MLATLDEGSASVFDSIVPMISVGLATEMIKRRRELSPASAVSDTMAAYAVRSDGNRRFRQRLSNAI